MPSLTDTLDVLRPLLPPPLVSADAFARARAAVEHLRPEITDGIHFECRLHGRSARVDLILIVRPEDGALLAGPAARTPPGVPPGDRGWRRLAAFCRRWTASGSPLRELIDHVWLEYDVAAGGETGRPAPGVFCLLRRPRRAADPARELRRRTLTLVEALTGRPASRVVRECLSAGLGRLPADASVPYVGFMIGRRSPTIRLCIAKLPLAEAETYCAATAAVGGPEVARIASRAALPDGAGGRWYVPMLHLDVDERRGFLRRIGMERSFRQPCQLAGEMGAAERRLLDTLTAQDLCTREKRDALLTWPGCSVAMLGHELGWSTFERRINHLKFVHEPGVGTETKGYLFARYRRRNRGPEQPTCAA